MHRTQYVRARLANFGVYFHYLLALVLLVIAVSAAFAENDEEVSDLDVSVYSAPVAPPPLLSSL